MSFLFEMQRERKGANTRKAYDVHESPHCQSDVGDLSRYALPNQNSRERRAAEQD